MLDEIRVPEEIISPVLSELWFWVGLFLEHADPLLPLTGRCVFGWSSSSRSCAGRAFVPRSSGLFSVSLSGLSSGSSSRESALNSEDASLCSPFSALLWLVARSEKDSLLLVVAILINSLMTPSSHYMKVVFSTLEHCTPTWIIIKYISDFINNRAQKVAN